MFQLRGLPGLADALRSEGDAAEDCQQRVQSSGIDGLDVFPCGPKPSDPTVLLSGPRMADLVAWAETAYDQVLIDCPPTLAASDAAIIGRLADGVVLVVQPEKNHRRLVLRATESLRVMQVQLVGVVANRVSTEKEGGYYGAGYGYGYGYGYGAGYGDREDEEGSDQSSVASETDDTPRGGRPVAPRRAA
jgi:Mrp family chromosome partitioning ATPase